MHISHYHNEEYCYKLAVWNSGECCWTHIRDLTTAQFQLSVVSLLYSKIVLSHYVFTQASVDT